MVLRFLVIAPPYGSLSILVPQSGYLLFKAFKYVFLFKKSLVFAGERVVQACKIFSANYILVH
jgi:hypothetical protein